MNNINSNYIYQKQEKAKRNRKIKKYKRITFFLTIFLFAGILIFLFLLSDKAKIYHYSIKGNKILKDSYLKQYLKEDNYYLTFNFNIKNKLKKIKLIDDVKVKHLPYNIIEIDIYEKDLIAYSYEDNFFIDTNKKIIAIDNDFEYIKSLIPVIKGFNKDEIMILVDYFKDLDKEIIKEISEIIKYPFSFDEMNMQIILRDGNNVLASKEALYMLIDIHSIISNIKKQPSCIFLDELTSTAFTSKCPWDKSKEDTIKEDDKQSEDDNQ